MLGAARTTVEAGNVDERSRSQWMSGRRRARRTRYSYLSRLRRRSPEAARQASGRSRNVLLSAPTRTGKELPQTLSADVRHFERGSIFRPQSFFFTSQESVVDALQACPTTSSSGYGAAGDDSPASLIFLGASGVTGPINRALLPSTGTSARAARIMSHNVV
jgi:hypothetical protein